jgi:hypothetical protein
MRPGGMPGNGIDQGKGKESNARGKAPGEVPFLYSVIFVDILDFAQK